MVLFQTSIYSCKQNNSIEKIWMIDKWTQSLESNEYKEIVAALSGESDHKDFKLHLDSLYNGTVDDKLIYRFRDDSLLITHFNKTRYEGYTKSIYKYDYISDSIFLTRDRERVVSFKVEKLTEEPSKLDGEAYTYAHYVI